MDARPILGTPCAPLRPVVVPFDARGSEPLPAVRTGGLPGRRSQGGFVEAPLSVFSRTLGAHRFKRNELGPSLACVRNALLLE